MNNFEYIALFITESSRNKLLQLLPDFEIYPECKLYLHHCTLLHKSQLYLPDSKKILSLYRDSKGKFFEIEITHLGWNDKAVAFKCNIHNLPFTGKFPHITIVTFNEGKPVDSNTITKWIKLDPIQIQTILKHAISR